MWGRLWVEHVVSEEKVLSCEQMFAVPIRTQGRNVKEEIDEFLSLNFVLLIYKIG